LVGHIESSGHKLVSEAQAQEWETQLLSWIISAPARALAAERDLGSLIAFAVHRSPEEIRSKVRRDAQDEGLLVALIAAHRGEVRSDAGRSLQLRWDHLVQLLGEDLLIQRVQELSDSPEGLDEDTALMIEQARRYAGNPEEASNELEEYRRRWS
jgi:hypothetical protein